MFFIDEPFDTIITICDYINNDTCEVGASMQIISKQHTQIVKTSKKAKSNQQKWPGWLNATLDAVGAAFLWLASPVRPVWGDYTELGQNTTAPLALFRRSTFEQDRLSIIDGLSIVNSEYNLIYTDMMTTLLSTPGGWGTSGSQAPNAAYAKFGAFVLLMGVDNTGAPLSSTDSTTIATNVLSILNTCFYYTPKSWFEGGE